jgi:hypothetical protein
LLELGEGVKTVIESLSHRARENHIEQSTECNVFTYKPSVELL